MITSSFAQIILIRFDSEEVEGELPSIKGYFETALNDEAHTQQRRPLSKPSISFDNNVLAVSQDYGNAMRCFLSLGWSLPTHLIDLKLEAKNINYHLSNLVTPTDLDQLLSQISMPYAIKRGEFLKASALIEQNGIPFDAECLSVIRNNREAIKRQLITEQDENGLYIDGAFSDQNFRKLLIEQNISWPLDSNNQLILNKEVFAERRDKYPQLTSLYQLRSHLSKLRKFNLPIGKDLRNRTHLKPFMSKTGRSQPGGSNFIFAQPAWLRGLIRPADGFGVAYIDYRQQEFGIAAALSGDAKMKSAYLTGDPYLAFAKQAGAAPCDATKQTYKEIRDQFKSCALAVQYGMGAKSLACRIKSQLCFAENLIDLHKKTYCDFWAWSDAVVNYAMTHHKIQTVYDWRFVIESTPNTRFIRNYPMQANGAEMLRLACCMLLNESIKVCAPVHDAVLIEAPIDQLDDTIQRAQQIMATASADILDGFTLTSDIDVVRFPDRFQDERGISLWKSVTRHIAKT